MNEYNLPVGTQSWEFGLATPEPISLGIAAMGPALREAQAELEAEAERESRRAEERLNPPRPVLVRRVLKAVKP
jgi:hypothetical protein